MENPTMPCQANSKPARPLLPIVLLFDAHEIRIVPSGDRLELVCVGHRIVCALVIHPSVPFCLPFESLLAAYSQTAFEGLIDVRCAYALQLSLMTIYSRLRPNIPWIAEGQECSYRSRTGSPIDSIDYNALVQVWVAESRKLSRKSR